MKKGNFEKQINEIPREVKWCKLCTMSNQRPRIKFDSSGVCAGCLNKSYKSKINWSERERELKELLDKHRSKNGSYDVIVPSSGGKDSGYVAHTLKYKYNMNPLTVTWSPLSYTDIGKKNFYGLVNSGLTNFLCTINGSLQRKLARLSLEELGDAFHVFVLGQISFPFHIAKKLNIKLVFYGENGELEYAGDVEGSDKPYKEPKFWTKQHFKGSDIKEIIKFGLKEKDYLLNEDINHPDLSWFTPPSEGELFESGIKGKYFFSYYHNWTPQENYYYCSKNTGFLPSIERNEGTYSRYASLDDKIDGFHYYMRYIKFGLGRCAEDTAHEIRDGHITRKEGVALMRKYEGEFPKKYYNFFLKYLNINQKQFNDIVDSWRSEHLWEKKNNKWTLKYPIK